MGGCARGELDVIEKRDGCGRGEGGCGRGEGGRDRGGRWVRSKERVDIAEQPCSCEGSMGAEVQLVAHGV